MSGDIVERLRVDYVCDEHTWKELEEFAIRNDAANEIVRLRTLITEWYASFCEQTKLHLTNDTEQLCLAMYRHDLAAAALIKEACREQ